MTLRQILLAGTALGAAAMMAGPAFAGSAAASQGEIDALKAQVEALTQRLDDIQIQSGNEIKEIKEKQDAVQLDFKDGKPTFRTGDGLFTMSIRGRAHLDMASYNVSDADTAKLATLGSSTTGLNSGFNFRRGELGVEGTFMRDWGYKMNFQWGDSGNEKASTIKDLYLSYNGIKGISLMAGAIQTFQTLDDSTSSNDITFIERSTAANLTTSLGAGDGRISFGGRGNTENFYASLFYTTETVGQANTSNEGSNVVARTAFRFVPMDKANIHLGLSGTYAMDPSANGGTAGSVRFRDRPELRVDPSRIVDTGAIAANDAYIVGPELAANYGPFKVQGEYYYYKVDRIGTLPDPDFNSWYVQASWVLTGEEYKYSMEEAAYKGVKPANPFSLGGSVGAWEVAARYSQTDLNYNDGSLAAAGGIAGGKQDIITVGLNWYPINNVRAMLEYLNVSADKRATGGAAVQSIDYDAVAARLQFAF
ncbi:MAG: OprO/OprP family phosphate-selective porin [Parvibaculum sp.]|uniref:OprO/OprP family phosphate-selective porin n=1 Tax=Parvibaculum sp. TaxID=2024848 RepID=UPI0025D1C53D|nr:porin [Parvibaculum sp.]MCE9650007.1 OprO/OprP family phosphate-selective porin [Parvibaculum sp.]